jgi:hypothetical protein
MPRHLALQVASLVITALPLAAQAGNEIVFVGTSVGGNADPHYFVASGTGAIANSGGNVSTDNVTDAVWADTGRNLYVSQSIQPRVSRAQWNGTTPAWSTFYAAPGACYGLGHDRGRQRLWVLTGPSGSTRELHCLDADPNSAGYGTLITQTTVLGTASRERWELSPSGNLAAVPHVFLQGGLFQIVDTDPASATFLQIVVSTTVPNATGGFSFATDCAISIDDQYAYLLYTGLGTSGLAVMHIPTATWLDFDSATPGQQDFVITLAVPNLMALSIDRSFAVVSGQGGGGWLMRIDFDYTTPANTTTTQYLQGQNLLPNCNGVSLSEDNTRVAVTATPTNLATPSYLVILDALTGAQLQYVTLPAAWNVYTTAWQDASPVASYVPFGAGCAGTLGVPSLHAAAGSRPALGSPFAVEVHNLPVNLAILTVGFSNTASGAIPLPLPLGSFGMPGCSLLADPLATVFLVGAAQSATWNWNVPNGAGFFGLQFYNQAFVLDGPANAAGLTASNGGAGWIGL